MRTWYKKWIAMILAVILSVSNIAPASVWAKSNIVTQVETEEPQSRAVQRNTRETSVTNPVFVGGTGYETLKEAITNAANGSTITLKSDVTVAEQLNINKNLTIVSDGSDHAIRREENYQGKLFQIASGVTFTIGGEENTGKVIVDGGANWVKDQEGSTSTQEEEKAVTSVKSPVEKDAYNNGMVATGALIWIQNGTLKLAATGVLQNNDLQNGSGAAVATSSGGSSKVHIYGTIQNNKASNNGGSISSNGYVNVYDGAVFSGNKAEGNGGAIENYGGGIMTFQGGTFQKNLAKNGGAIATDGKLELQKGTFSGNTASEDGGAVYVGSSNDSRSALFYGGQLTDNTAQKGKDIYQSTENAKYKGAVSIGEVYVKGSQYLRITGALSGKIGVSYAAVDPGQEGAIIARGDGYTLSQSDVSHLSSYSNRYVIRYQDNMGYLHYAPVIIDTQPQGIAKIELQEQAALTIEAHSIAETEVSYQWYQCSDTNGNDAKKIEGATKATYQADTSEVGLFYYYCVVSAPQATETKSKVVSVKVIDSASAEIPQITAQPEDGTYDLHKEATLTIEAAVEDGGELSYQWYRLSDPEQEEGIAIAGATKASYQVDTSQSGSFSYYCVVTNTNDKENITNKTATKQSRVATVTVTEAAVTYNNVSYSSLDDALVEIDGNVGGTLEILKDVTVSRSVTITGGDLTVTAPEGTNPVMKLTTSHTGEAFIVRSGSLTLENVILDGGAIWSGSDHFVMKRGTNNQGRSVNAPLITMNGGTVNLNEGTILQNNVANWTSSCVVMTAGTLNINGASLQDCYGGSHGGVIYSSGSNSIINMTGGKIIRNQARSSTGGLCADTGTQLTIRGGEIAYNYTVGRAGGVFINGSLDISGDTDIHDNYAGGNGGGVLHLTGSFTMEGGTIRNNTALSNGGGIASLGGTATFQDGKISGNTASVQGNGIYLESGVAVTGDHVPAGVTDAVYSAKTVTLSLNGNGSGTNSQQTIHYLGLYDLPEAQRNGYQFLGWFTEAEGGEQVQSGDRITTKTNITLYAHWLLTATNLITIETAPKGGTYYIEDAPKLTVEASAVQGNLNYQWYQCQDENRTGATPVGENSKEFSLPTQETEIGNYYYYCVVSAEDRDAEDVMTDVVSVNLISKEHASAPVFTTEPTGGELFVGEEMVLSAEASVNDNGTVSYQWYVGNTEEFAAASPIKGANEAEYTVQSKNAGTKYYFVEAINTKTNTQEEEIQEKTASRGAKIISHNKITVKSLSSSDALVSADYWKTYRVGTEINEEDGYITQARSVYGNYSNNSAEKYAFDGKSNTFWETSRGGVNNRMEMTFNKPVKLDRIVYSTRQDGYAGRGYPTTMTILSKNSQGVYEEVGVAKSQESGGYVLFTLPETITSYGVILEFTTSTFNNWATAAEIVLLRAEDTVMTGSVSIQGNAVPGQSLMAYPAVTVGPAVNLLQPFTTTSSLAYQWQSSEDGQNFTNIDGATEQSYVIREEDKNKYLRVVLRDSGEFYSGSIVSEPYRGMFEATLEGNPVVGETVKPKISYMTGNSVDYSYQWQRSTGEGEYEDIVNANQESYTITSADAGHTVRVAVSVSVEGQTYVVYSNEADIEVSAILTGAPQVGNTLTASLNGVKKDLNIAMSYQWQVSDEKEGSFSDLSEAINQSYTIPSDIEGKYIRAEVTVTDTQHVYTTEAWKVLGENTIQDCEGDFMYLSDIDKKKILTGKVGFGELEYDRNTSQNRISLLVDGVKNYFMKGFGAHADATLIFDVSDYTTYYHYDRFIAYLGLDSAQGNNGNGVTFTVSTSQDGQKYETVQTTGVLKGNTNAVPVDIDLNGAKYLKIYIGTNGNAASDHAVVADAKLANKDYVDDSRKTNLFKTVAEYDQEIKDYEIAHPEKSHTELLKDDAYRKLIYQRSFVKGADYQLLKAYLYDEDYVKTFEWFFNDMEALDLYTGGGAPEGSYANFVEVLKNLYISHGSDMDDETNGSLYKKMIITTALTHSATVTYWADSSVKSNAVRRYEIYKKLYDNKLLLNDVFKNLTVEEMRWVINNISADEEIEWLNYYVRYHTNKKDLAANNQLTLNNFTPGPYYFITYTMGFNYYQPRFYSADNKESWQKKYSLTNETADPKVEPYDLNVTYANNHPRLWIVWEAGAVCGGISKTGTNLLTAFGVPGVVIGQPGHAAYFQYFESADGKGKWEIYNDVSGWTLSEKGERMLNGWGNSNWDSGYQGSYVLLAQAALNEGQKYFTSQELVKLADVYKDNPEKQIEIYEEALDVLDLNMDAWVGMINAYKAADKDETAMLQLAGRISKALAYYPLPMRDILTNLIKPTIKSEVGKAEVSMDVQTALRAAAAATTNDTLQPNHCKTMANYLLGNTDPVATFSFDGAKAGTVVLNDSFSGGNELLISINGGSSWINAGTTKEYKFTPDQLEQINADDDIRVKLQGTSNYYTIDITKGTKPTNLYNNDLENRITGNITGLEWKEKDGTTWENLTSETTITGNQTIVVRRKAAGTKAASDSTEYSFTQDKENLSRKYIPLRHVSYVGCSSAETGKGEAATNILDGNIYTIWHTAWNGSDSERSITVKLDEPRYLTSIDYTPRQGAGNGTFQNVEIYTSMDGSSWVLSGTASGWANDGNKKTIDLFAPVYTSYVKVKATRGVNGYASGAMLEFFEDTTVEDKTVEHIELRSAPSKTTYMVGDELNTTGLSVMAYYDDGTYSTMNNELLAFTPSVFRNTGTQTVQVAYRLDDKVTPITFDVTVEENTRTADAIEIVELPDKTRYFVGDTLDLTGLLVKAHYTDGSTGYLFDDQFTASPEVLNQDGAEVPVTVSYVQGTIMLTDEFHVEVTKQVKALEVSQKPQKDSYNLGESFDDTELEMTLVYKDDTKETIGASEYTIESQGFSDTSGTKNVEISYNRKPEIKTSIEVLVYPYITSGYLQLESDEGATSAYVSGTVENALPEGGKITIPSQVTVEEKLNFTVTKIASQAFAGKTEITSVLIPNTVTTIDSGAFTGCSNLKEIYLTDYTNFKDFTVADDAFGDLEGGIIYVANAEMAKELADKNLAGLKNFTIVPMTEKITSVQVTAPEKTEYHLGEEMDLTGLTVKGILENGESLTLSENLYELSDFDSSKAGKQTMTVSAKGTELCDTFEVTVTPAEPVIELQPENATYDTTEFPEPLQVQASISDAGHLQYQWYVSDTEDGTFTKLSAETGTSCAVTPNETKYYYVEVSNNDADGAEETAVKVQSNVVKIEFGSYEARIKGNAYKTVKDAISAATSGDTVQLIKNVMVDSAITINKNLTLTGYGLYRKTGYTGKLIEITAGNVIFKDLIVDGGAVWSGTVNSILNRGTSNSGTNTITSQTAIESKETMVYVTGGELQLAEGASLQNNCNSSGNYGNSGGAVRISGGKLRINGGQIVNNYCNPYGGAVLSLNSSSVILEKGRIAGNQSSDSGGTFCVDGNSTFTMKDSGDTNMPSIIEDNNTQTNGGAIWLSNGKVILEGGVLRNNRANSNGGVVYMSGSGTVELGSAMISGNQAGARGNGIHANNGTLNITGVPNMSDQIYLPANKMINVKADLSAIEQKIPVGVASYNSAGAQFGTATSKELAQKAAQAFTVTGGDLPVYAYNGGLYYGNPTTVTLTKDLPQQATVMAGKQLTLSVEASIDPADAGELVYKWYRCSDAEGNGATLVTTSQSDQPNVLSLGDCSEGICYFYCEVSASNGKADTVRSSICTVTVTKFVPASKAIEKMNQLS